MDDDRSDADPPAWRLHAITDDDLDEIAYLEACGEAEQSATLLIEDARHEAGEQGQLALHHARLALEHAARQLQLLQLADRVEQAIRHSSHLLLPPPFGK